ncbi:MAG: protein YgfX [Enterobacterales bacterium endosymbiont of Blomia tropicalis]|nr:protein YgfX [Mixta mediterraneensis]
MNVAQWRCNLRPSRRARQFHGMVLSGAMAFVVLMPAHENALILKLMLLALMGWEGWRNDRRLARRRGWLQRESAQSWRWQGVSWQPQQPLLWLPAAVLLVGKNAQGERLRMWVRQDNMQPVEWRALRACCLRESAAVNALD